MVLETYSGMFFDYENPRPAQIVFNDIAESLGNVARFGGHTTRHYTVLEHALLVAKLVARKHSETTLRLAALHHDSHEAYLGDIPTPLKLTLGQGYRDLVDRADQAIAWKLGIPVELFTHPAVKGADALALRIEAAWLKRSAGVGEHWGNDGIPAECLWLRIDRHNPPDRDTVLREFGLRHREYGGPQW